MSLIVTTIESVEPWGEKLTLVKVVGIDKTVVANRKDDGSFRWAVRDVVVYVPEATVLPQDVLEERGYWEAGAKKGMLGTSKGNKVKNRTFGRVTAEDGTVTDPGVESSGLLFRMKQVSNGLPGDVDYIAERGDKYLDVKIGDDVAEFFGATFPE